MKADLTHQHVARVLLADFPHLYATKELNFLRHMSTIIYMSEKQEAWLANLDERRKEAVR